MQRDVGSWSWSQQVLQQWLCLRCEQALPAGSLCRPVNSRNMQLLESSKALLCLPWSRTSFENVVAPCPNQTLSIHSAATEAYRKWTPIGPTLIYCSIPFTAYGTSSLSTRFRSCPIARGSHQRMGLSAQKACYSQNTW